MDPIFWHRKPILKRALIVLLRAAVVLFGLWLVLSGATFIDVASQGSKWNSDRGSEFSKCRQLRASIRYSVTGLWRSGRIGSRVTPTTIRYFLSSGLPQYREDQLETMVQTCGTYSISPDSKRSDDVQGASLDLWCDSHGPLDERDFIAWLRATSQEPSFTAAAPGHYNPYSSRRWAFVLMEGFGAVVGIAGLAIAFLAARTPSGHIDCPDLGLLAGED